MSGGRTALFVSLAVNVLLIGVIAGVGLSELRHSRARAHESAARAPNMRAIMQSLPPERAAEVRGKVVGAFRDAAPERQAARAARQEIARIAGADTYDPVAAKAAFARMREADGKLAAHFQDVVADSMASLTVDERRALVRRLVQRRAEHARRAFGARLRDGAAPVEENAADAPQQQP